MGRGVHNKMASNPKADPRLRNIKIKTGVVKRYYRPASDT